MFPCYMSRRLINMDFNQILVFNLCLLQNKILNHNPIMMKNKNKIAKYSRKRNQVKMDRKNLNLYK